MDRLEVVICAMFGISAADLRSTNRSHSVVVARRVLVYVAVSSGLASATSVARRIDKHPTTMTRQYRIATALVRSADPRFDAFVAEARCRTEAPSPALVEAYQNLYDAVAAIDNGRTFGIRWIGLVPGYGEVLAAMGRVREARRGP